ncbi:putative tick transposon, partial [Operophtera brumata]
MDEIVSLTRDIENLNLADSFICAPEDTGQYLRYGNNSLKLLHLNIRSINCNFDGLLLLLHRIQSHLDIIILSECWLSKCPSLPSLPGFSSYASDYKSQNEGVVAYVRVELSCDVVFPTFDDANCLLLKIDDKIAVVALYRSPSIKNIDRFLNSLDYTLKQLNSFSTVVIIGDMNINIVPNSKDPNSDDYLNLTASHAMLPAYVLPTRLNSCLDHVILKSPFSAVSLVLDSLITDHAPILFCIAMSTRPKSLKSTTIQQDIPSMIQEIDKTDFSSILLLTDANYAALILVDLLASIVQKHTRKVNIPNKKRIIKPWITPGLLKCIRHRDKLYRRHKKENDNKILKITFTRYRNFCNNLLKRVKREYERSELHKAKNNPKATWNLVKKIANLNRKQSPTEELLKLADTPELSVNIANKFFANVGKNLA